MTLSAVIDRSRSSSGPGPVSRVVDYSIGDVLRTGWDVPAWSGIDSGYCRPAGPTTVPHIRSRKVTESSTATGAFVMGAATRGSSCCAILTSPGWVIAGVRGAPRAHRVVDYPCTPANPSLAFGSSCSVDGSEGRLMGSANFAAALRNHRPHARRTVSVHCSYQRQTTSGGAVRAARDDTGAFPRKWRRATLHRCCAVIRNAASAGSVKWRQR